jgi:D-ribose pyranase
LKKIGVLNKDISELIASMGHFDQLTICDAGLPIPEYVWRIDLAVKEGLPGFVEVAKAVANDMVVQQVIMAEEIKKVSPHIDKQIRDIFVGVEVVYISHEVFKEQSTKSRAIIRTGEFTPYSNLIIVSGVSF